MSRSSQLMGFAERDPTNPILLCDLLDALLAEGRVDEAMTRVQAAPAVLQALPGVKFRQARCAMLRRDFAAAIAILQPLLVDTVAVPPAGIAHDLAYAQFALGQLDAAMHTLAIARAEGEDTVAFALLKARILHHQRQYAPALEALDVVTDGPRLAEAWGLRSLLLLDQGDTAQAMAAASHALELEPSQLEANITRGTVALGERHLDEARQAFEQVLEMDARSGRALLGMGQIDMLHGDVSGARALLEHSAREMPGHIGTWHALAWCQLLEGDLAGAKSSFDRVFAIDRTFGETHGGLALVHALRGERQEAEESIKRATRLDPHGTSARYARSVLLLDEGHPEDAKRIVDGIVAQSVHQPLPADFIYRLRELVRPRG